MTETKQRFNEYMTKRELKRRFLIDAESGKKQTRGERGVMLQGFRTLPNPRQSIPAPKRAWYFACIQF